MFDANEMTGALVRRTREERIGPDGKPMSQAELARRVGVTPAQICYLEAGLRPWSLDMVAKVATVLGVDLQRLVPTVHPSRNGLPKAS